MFKFVLIICVLLTSSLYGSVLMVGEGQKYSSLTAAIERAMSGDTIKVFQGVYIEGNIVVNKSLVLLGVDYPVLDGEGKVEILSIKASNVVVKGFVLRRSGISSLVDFAAVKVYGGHDVEITGNKIEECFFGIYVQNGRSVLIKDNFLTANNPRDERSGNGIHCWKSSLLRITDNQVSGHRDGIYFEFVDESIIERNMAQNNIRYGLHFMFSDHNRYAQNTFSNNGAGVAVMYSSFVEMTENKFINNWGASSYGLLLKEINDSKILNNIFSENTSAIYVEGANRMDIIGNIFERNGWALKIQASCMGVLLERNDFMGNSFDVATNGTITMYKFQMNYWDKYEGYDLNKDQIGDIPYRPISLYAMIIEKYPAAIGLFRSFMTVLLDKSEKIIPSITPENLMDNQPAMKPNSL